METLPTAINIEKTVDNEWFIAHFVRNDGVRLFGHVQYKVWNKTAKIKTKEVLDSIDEPVHAYAHNQRHLKFILSLGFVPTGNFFKTEFPGKEEEAFGELVYYKDGVTGYALKAYGEFAEAVLPLSAVDGYGKIQEVEEKLKELDQVKWTTKHHFSDGVYTRETFIPSGTILTGYRHKKRTVSILAQGAISVMSVDRLGRATDLGVMVSPMVVVTEPGSKKIGIAHEDTVFINSFDITDVPNDLRNEENIKAIEDLIFDLGED